jgi:hypothetical protein
LRAKARFANKTAANRKKTKQRKQREVEADPSLHDEDIAEQHLSSEAESEVDESPLGLLLTEPRRPKDNPDLPTMREIESLPVLRLFKHHLKDFAGGSRKQDVAKDHTRRVCCLLYEVQDPATNVNQLWDNRNINILLNNFFRGNDKLGEGQATAPDAKGVHYIIEALLPFCYCDEDIRMLGETLTTEDIHLINSALTRLGTWPKAFSDAANLRK